MKRIVQITTTCTPSGRGKNIIISRADGVERKYKFSTKNSLNLIRCSPEWKVSHLFPYGNVATRI